MIRTLTYVLCFSLALTAVGCQGNDRVVGAPTFGGGADTRTLDDMRPNIKKSLTPTIAEATFGPPDQRTGSGLVILVYNVDNGRKVNLAFPGPTALISYASVQEQNGGTTTIPLLD